MISWDRVQELRDEIGDEDFEEVAGVFLDEVDEVIARLKSTPNPATYEEDLHFLKGSALNLGFQAMSKLCQEGEAQAAAGSAASIALEQVFTVYDQSRQAFEAGPA
jgi:HPt (histidine-containing phosphotransfer) domain-containing protein